MGGGVSPRPSLLNTRAAMTFSDRIETLVGSYPYGTRLEQILDEAARLLIAELPEAMLMSFASEETDDGTTGVDVTNKRIVKAHKNGYPARLIDETLRTRLTNTAEPTPVYYVLNNTAYVKPEGGTITTISFPTIKRTDSTVSGWPTMLVDLLVERAALLILDLLMVDIREGYGTSVTLPTIPAAPAAPSFSATDAAAVAPSATSVSALPTAPVYSEPNLDAANVVPSVGTLTISEVAPTAPSAPTISYADATAATVSTTTVASLGTAPTYIKPTYSGNISTVVSAVPSLLDLSTELDNLTSLSVPAAPSAPSLSSAGQATVTVDFTTPQSVEPAYTKETGTLATVIADWDAFYDSEDPEMMREALARVQTELADLQRKISDERNDLEEQVTIYRAEIEKAVADAQIAAQEAANELSATDQMTLQQYIQSLNRYDKELAEYQSNISVQTTEFDANLQRAITGLVTAERLFLEQYSLDIQNETNEFQKELAVYQQDAAHKIEQARVALQEALADAQSSTEVSVRNEAATLEAAIQDYNLELSLFERKLALYQAKVEVEIQEYVADLDRLIQLYSAESGVKIERYSVLLQNARGKFEKELAVYNAGVQLNNLQAEITAREAAQTASQSTEVAVQNKARQLEKEVQQYQSVLAKYQSDLQSYSEQVQAALSNQGVVTESVAAKIRMIAFDKERHESRYMQRFRAFMRAFYPRKSYTIRQHAI
jgi:hypothetical protein